MRKVWNGEILEVAQEMLAVSNSGSAEGKGLKK